VVSRSGNGVRTIAPHNDAILNGAVEVRVPVEARAIRSWEEV